MRFDITFEMDTVAVAADSLTDGIFPLTTNDTQLSALDALLAYKGQPTIEKRFSQLKTDFEVAPVYLKEVARIEALLFMYFFVLVVQALIGRTFSDFHEIPVGYPSVFNGKKGDGVYFWSGCIWGKEVISWLFRFSASAKARVEAFHPSAETARLAPADEQKKYDAGKSTINFLLDAEAARLPADSQYSQALHEKQIAIVNLRLAAGTLLQNKTGNREGAVK